MPTSLGTSLAKWFVLVALNLSDPVVDLAQ